MEQFSGAEAPLTLMIVEDDKDSRDMLKIILAKKFPDIAIQTAVNGKDGVELFEKTLPEIIMSDVNMPEMNGIEMIRIVRKIKPETKIIMITADTGKATLEGSVGEGFRVDHYVLKPIDYKKLFTAIEQCIEEIRSV